MTKKIYGMDEKEFRKLQDEWEKKLADSGFVDVEYRMNGEPAHYMRGPNPMDFIRQGSQRIADAQEYYGSARAWAWHLREAQAPREVCRIWGAHSEGNSFADICQALGYGRGLVQRIVREQREAMMKAVRHHKPPFDGG